MTNRDADACTRDHRRFGQLAWIGIAFFAGGVLAWGGWCAHLGLSVRAHTLSARTTLQSFNGPAALQTMLDGDVAELTVARAELGRAQRDIASPWLAPLRAAPLVGTQIASIGSLTGSARRILDAVIAAGNEFGPDERGRMSRLDLLRALGRTTSQLRAVIDEADLGPSSGLLPTLAKAHAEFALQLQSARAPLIRAQAALPGLESLFAGPSHLLLVAANNAQMAAGSGLPLATATMDITQGQIDVGTFVWASDIKVPAGAVELPPELQPLWSFATPQDSINRSMPSPLFPVTGPMLAAQYSAATGKPVDGVVMIDIVGLQKLAEAHGNFSDPRALQPDQVIPELMHDQYVGEEPNTTVDHRQREARLGEASRVIVSDLLSSTGSLARLARALSEAVAGRHLLLWSRVDAQRTAFSALGADGDLTPDSVFVALQNESSNKLDWFVRTNATLSVDQRDAGHRVVTVDISVSCNVPDGEPLYVAGSVLPRVKYGDYVGYLTLHVPLAATDVRISDNAPVIVKGADGPTTVIGRLLVVPRNTTAKVTFTFVLPTSTTHLVVEPSARYPAITWTDGTRSWRDDDARTITLTDGREADAA